MKIYTKTGDDGTTALFGGVRLPKSDVRIHAYGTVDELNSILGMLGTYAETASEQDLLVTIQSTLFTVGSHLAAAPGKQHDYLPALPLDAEQVLEHSIDQQETQLPPLRNFVLPGGHPANATAHLARTVCRRAERWAVALAAQESETHPVDPALLRYLNRLSDWLFVYARTLSHRAHTPEILWNPNNRPTPTGTDT